MKTNVLKTDFTTMSNALSDLPNFACSSYHSLATMRAPSSAPAHATDLPYDISALDTTEPNMMRNLEDLPDEVLQHILYYLEPEETLLSVQLVSRRIYTLIQEPLLWRYHCKTSFHYWDEKHDIRRRFNGHIDGTDWLELFLERRHADATTTRLVDSILSEQIGRIDKTNQIGAFGYDAKDTLLRHRRASPNSSDVLARRYYSNAILDHIQREQALKVWQALNAQQAGRYSNIPPEKALGCFDMFILHEHFGDFDEVAELLDGLRDHFQGLYPDFRHYNQREKAITITQYLRNHDWTGMEDEARYRYFQNNYIGAALQDPKHPSLPLIAVVLYCALARRLGVEAHFVNFTYHAYATVILADGEQMYLDPYGSTNEVPRSILVQTLVDRDVPIDAMRHFLEPSTLQAMVVRSANNILESLKGDNIRDDDWIAVRGKGLSHPVADSNDAIYSGVWAVYMMSTSPIQARIAIPHIIRSYESDYPMDGVLIEQYMCNRPGYLDEELKHLIRETIRVTRTSDSVPKAVKRRDGTGFRDKVQYEVGQVFLHKRERYIAVICGWDEQCKMENRWIRAQGVDMLPRGRAQSFYHSLVHDATSRYVAEENIEILEPIDPPLELLPMAGKCFKRWDRERHRFVSNIQDEYPDN